GGRFGDGVHGRHPLLVAQGDRPAVSGRPGQVLRDPDVRRLQPDVFPAVHPRLRGHAAALPLLRAALPGPQCAVVGRLLDPGAVLPAAAAVPAVVAALRQTRRQQSVAGARPGVAGALAAAQEQLQAAARAPRSLRLRRARAINTRTMHTRHLKSTAGEVEKQFDDPVQQRNTATVGMWIFLATEIMFFGVLFAAYTILRILHPAGFAEASRDTDLLLGSIETSVLLVSSVTV